MLAGSMAQRLTPHHVRSRSPENQPGAEVAMGEGEGSQAEAHGLGSRQEADRGGAESTVGEGEARRTHAMNRGAAGAGIGTGTGLSPRIEATPCLSRKLACPCQQSHSR